MRMEWDLEERCRLALEEADMGVQVDADLLADRLGLTVIDAPTEGRLAGRMILVDETLRTGCARATAEDWTRRESALDRSASLLCEVAS